MTHTTSRKYEISELNSTDEEEEADRRTEVDSNIEQCWKSVKEVFNETAKNVLGFKQAL